MNSEGRSRTRDEMLQIFDRGRQSQRTGPPLPAVLDRIGDGLLALGSDNRSYARGQRSYEDDLGI